MPDKAKVVAALRDTLKMTPEKIRLIETYIKLLREKNKELNLTAITEEGEIWRKHVLDSLLIFLSMDIPLGASLIDVGTGAGIPGLLLKIYRPDLRISLLDARKKKINFLRQTIFEMGIKNTECIWGRAEKIGQDINYRENFHIAVARGVGKLNLLAEYCLPLVKVDGFMVAYKGPEGEKELISTRGAISLLGGKEKKIWQGTLISGLEKRQLIIIKKEMHTPNNYPRRPGIPAKRPLK